MLTRVDLESSPIRYDPSSSPGRNNIPQSDLRSESSGLFVDSLSSSARRPRRGDIHPEGYSRTPRPVRRILLDEAGRVIGGGPVDGSEAGSFANNNLGTSEAQALGGQSQSLIWGTTISIDDAFTSFKDFLRNFTKKYRMWLDGMTEEETALQPDAELHPYMEALENMLLLGTSRLYVDIRDVAAYPRTKMFAHQLQAYPYEIVPVMDQSVHDIMLELARAEMATQRTSQSSAGPSQPNASQSSEPAFPSSERGDEPATSRPAPDQQSNLEDQVSETLYVARPFGLDQTTNLRDLNPAGKTKQIRE